MITVEDTIDINYRSGGNPLHLIDQVNIGTVNLRPAAGFAEIHEFNLAENLYRSPAGFTYFKDERRAKVKRTSLPYLGFQYAFGSATNQAVNVDYHHYFKPESHVHFRYHRRTSNGLLRNGDFILNDINMLVFHRQERWHTSLDAYYGGYDYAENGGILTDSLIGFFPIEFTPVRKTSAKSKVRKIDINWVNYYDVYRDSVIAHGLKGQTRYELVGREYTESPLSDQGFDTFYISPLSTRDQFQTPSISTGGGYFLSTEFFQVDATLNHRYWRNQNLGRVRDTTELFLHSKARIGWDKLNLTNEFYFNTLGALGEFYNRTQVFFRPIKKAVLQGGLNIDNRLPLPYQRFHVANNTKWELDELRTQQIVNINGRATYGVKNKVFAALNWTSVNNGLYFIDGEWRQDVLDFVSVGDLTLGSYYQTGNWSFYPKVTVRFNTENFNYQPAFSGRLRLAYQKGFFENESLIMAFGADVGYDMGYNHMIYNTLINVMEPGSSDMITPDLLRLNVFVAAQIDTFRFFLRAENIDYFINPQRALIDPLFPITPFIVRLGITWDFFN